MPVLGTTKPAIAATMKATEPSMLSHAIHRGRSRNRSRRNPTPRAERPERAQQVADRPSRNHLRVGSAFSSVLHDVRQV